MLMLSSFQEIDRALWVATVNVGAQGAVSGINIRLLLPGLLEKRKYIIYGLLACLVLFAFTKLYLTLVGPDFADNVLGA
ncbi:hypothetical protein PEC18_34075 [Paucibacter sp. O1-1]|nr:hypothetical protein [Paucibacter sp. O1-1]MDA3830720.1 hypothetical protein [Paucibacter sp. O1-1]